MSKFLVVAIFLVGTINTYSQTKANESDDLTWLTDISQAYTLSTSTKKPVFAFFTGSDWCGWCHKLEKEVFAKPEFVSWAKSNVVLLELDFPRRKQLPAELAQQNQSLQQFFGIKGYPTIWIFNMTKDTKNNQFMISALGSLGYPDGATVGKEEVKFLENANKIMSQKSGKPSF
jgi:protein disulfide-isomerase